MPRLHTGCNGYPRQTRSAMLEAVSAEQEAEAAAAVDAAAADEAAEALAAAKEAAARALSEQAAHEAAEAELAAKAAAEALASSEASAAAAKAIAAAETAAKAARTAAAVATASYASVDEMLSLADLEEAPVCGDGNCGYYACLASGSESVLSHCLRSAPVLAPSREDYEAQQSLRERCVAWLLAPEQAAMLRTEKYDAAAVEKQRKGKRQAARWVYTPTPQRCGASRHGGGGEGSSRGDQYLHWPEWWQRVQRSWPCGQGPSVR